MKRTVKITVGIIGVFVGMGFVMPAVALLRTSGSLPGFEVALLLLGIGLTLGGGSTAFCGIRKRGV